jgi:methionine synthase II (cobalamin-independent)
VGSLPRPSRLQQAYAGYDAGTIDREALDAEQDAAVVDSIGRGEATGAPIISDVAFQKIANRVEGTRMAAKELGVAVPAAA